MTEMISQTKNRSKLHLAFLILLAVALFSILFAIVTLLKNIEVIKTDPINYAINKTSLESCSCIDESGQLVFFGGGEIGVKNWSRPKS